MKVYYSHENDSTYMILLLLLHYICVDLSHDNLRHCISKTYGKLNVGFFC